MPDIVFVDDGAPSISSCSSSIRYRSPLRRRRTIQRLSQWVSKKVSNQYLTVMDHERAPENEGTYESYAAFCDAFTISGHQEKAEVFSIGSGTGVSDLQGNHTAPSLPDPPLPHLDLGSNSCYNDNNDPIIHGLDDDALLSPGSPGPERSVSLESQLPLSTSYAIYAHRSRLYSAETEKEEINFSPIVSPASTPSLEPPPRVLTPAIYAEKRRETREKKLKRRHSLWQSLRSLLCHRDDRYSEPESPTF